MLTAITNKVAAITWEVIEDKNGSYPRLKNDNVRAILMKNK